MADQLNCAFELLDIESLEMDLANPRVARILEMYPNPTREQVELALSGGARDDASGPSFQGLRQSIQTNRGIIHPIIVNRHADGRLVVIEGNTRTYIYRELRRTQPDGPWASIPAMVYDDLNPEGIDAIRLQAHLVGTREWDPYSKAKYLDMLRNRQNLAFSQIVDFCGGDRRDVQRYIDAYTDMETHYRAVIESDQDFDASRFSAFVELQKQTIKEAIAKAGFTKGDFAEWVHTHKLYPLQMIRKLPQVLKDDRARRVFLDSNIAEAAKVVDSPASSSNLQETPLEELAREFCRRIDTLNYTELQSMRRRRNDSDVTALFESKDVLVDLCRDIGIEE